jgi:hypothetical protein
MSKERLKIDLPASQCVLIPIDEKKYDSLRDKNIPIFQDNWYSMRLSRAIESEEPDFQHSHLYTALKTHFGETPAMYDDYKCSFGYPFLLEITKDRNEVKYLLNFTDMRGGVEFFFRKILDKHELNKYERDVFQRPFENEFSGDDMRYFMGWFLFYFVGFMKSYQKYYKEEFARSVEAALMIYGYRDGNFFDESYEDWDQYHQAKEKLKKTNIPFNKVKPNNLRNS